MLKTQIFRKYSKDKETLDTQEATLRFALLEEPNNKKYLKELANLLYYRKDCDGATKIYEKLVKLDNKNVDYLAFLGYLHYEKEEYQKAVDYLEEALDMSPEEPFIYFLLGNAYSRLGKIKDAIKNYDFAIFLDFDIYTAHLDFAKKYEDMGRRRKALKEYVIAFEIDPRDIEIRDKIKNLKEELEKEDEEKRAGVSC